MVEFDVEVHVTVKCPCCGTEFETDVETTVCIEPDDYP